MGELNEPRDAADATPGAMPSRAAHGMGTRDGTFGSRGHAPEVFAFKGPPLGILSSIDRHWGMPTPAVAPLSRSELVGRVRGHGTRTLVLLLLTCVALAIPTRADDREKLAALLAPAIANGGVVTIPPGDYRLDGRQPLPVPSRTTVFAHGARFILPDTLAGNARAVLFEGADVRDFAWHGGEFVGHVFDPARKENAWEPNANTRPIVITTTDKGPGTRDVLFRDVKASDVAGAVITVQGVGKGEAEVTRFAERVTVENCTLLRSGKFMWDYGYLWHQIVWPEEFEPWEVERAWKYCRRDFVREGLSTAAGDDRIRFDNRTKPIKAGASADPNYAVTLFGAAALPKPLVRGRQYVVVESGADYVKIADRPGSPPIRFDAPAENLKLAHDMVASYYGLYAPTGSGPGKGAVDLVACRDVRVSGCRLSALGDTMHIQKSHNVVFASNHIVGSRMGAFFLAEYCKNATITGNTVDGTNGSRVISVEKSCEDVTITGNTFRSGGRGSWINQPKNLVIANNVFVNNTTKNTPDPKRGRRAFQTADYETKPELYVTLYEKNATYGPVIIKDNIFRLGDHTGTPAITLAANGKDVVFTGNTFVTSSGNDGVKPVMRVDPTTDADLRDNRGIEVERAPVDFNHGRR